MRRIGIVESVTLDGVMQGPGHRDEDTRGGFTKGGWAVPYGDEVIGREMGKGIGSALLFGRRTYEQFHGAWADRTDDNPFTDVLNQATKYVASTALDEPLPWANSRLLRGDASMTVADLKATDGPDLVVLGSGDLVQTLLREGLIDEVTLLVHPLTLGTGRRLFRDGGPNVSLQLDHSVTSTTGVLIATYRPG